MPFEQWLDLFTQLNAPGNALGWEKIRGAEDHHFGVLKI